MFAVNSSDQVACACLQVDQRLRTHRFGDINGQSNRHTGSLLRFVSDVFGTNAENDFFIDVSIRERFQAAFERECQSVFLARFYKEQTAIAPLDLPFEEVHWRTTNEARDKEIFGLPVKSQRIGYLHDEAVSQDADAITHGHRLDLVVGHVNHCGTQLSVQAGDLRAHLDAHLRVQVGQRLGGEEYNRTSHGSATESKALALTARERVWFAIQHVVETERLCGSSYDFQNEFLLLLCQLKAERHVVEDGHVRIERIVLEDHRYPAIFRFKLIHYPATNRDRPARNLFKTGDHTKGSRLSAPRRSDKDHEFSVLDV